MRKWLLFLLVASALAGCASSAAYKRAVEGWNRTHTPELVQYTLRDSRLGAWERALVLSGRAGLPCLIDTDHDPGAIATAPACACAFARTATARASDCLAWALTYTTTTTGGAP